MAKKAKVVAALNTELVAAIALANGLRSEQEQLNGKRASATGAFMALAAVMSNAAFNAECDKLWDAIRDNKDGIANQTNCKLTANGKAYVVPGACSNARSIINAAAELGVDLMEDCDAPDASGVLRSFGEVRDEVRARQRALALAERSSAERARDDMVAKLAAVIVALESIKPNAAVVAGFGLLTDALEAYGSSLEAKSAAVEEELAGLAEPVAKRSRKPVAVAA